MIGALIQWLVGCALLCSELNLQIIDQAPAVVADAAAREIADLTRDLRGFADTPDPYPLPESDLYASIRLRWFSFSWRHALQPQAAPGSEGLRAAAALLVQRLDTIDGPPATDTYRYPDAVLWHALLLDMCGRSTEAQTVLAAIGRSNWAFDGCPSCEATFSCYDARLRAAIAEHRGDLATALRWVLDACLDSGEAFDGPDSALLWGYCAHLLASCGRDEEAVTLWAALVRLQPGTDAAGLALSELQRRGMTAVVERASFYVFDLWGRAGSVRSVFVVGRERDPGSWRTLAARRSVDGHGHGDLVLCPGDPAFDEPVRRGLEQWFASPDLKNAGAALIALHGMGVGARHFVLPFIARLAEHRPDFRDQWHAPWTPVDLDEPLRVILGDGPDRSVANGLDGPGLARTWFHWILEH